MPEAAKISVQIKRLRKNFEGHSKNRDLLKLNLFKQILIELVDVICHTPSLYNDEKNYRAEWTTKEYEIALCTEESKLCSIEILNRITGEWNIHRIIFKFQDISTFLSPYFSKK